MTLHLYWPSGEFIMADMVSLDDGIERYCQDLDEGYRGPPQLRITDETHGDRDLYHYTIVCNGVELEDGRTWADVVEEQGITGEEPVEVMVVLIERSPRRI